MKKYPYFLLFSACLFVAGCAKMPDDNFTKADFENDPEVHELYESIKPLSAVPITDPVAFKVILSIKNAADKVVKKYGLSNARNYSRELAHDKQFFVQEARLQPSCCNLNANGTTNWACCNFFETLVVTFDVYGMEPPEGASRSEIERYYKLVQASICANC